MSKIICIFLFDRNTCKLYKVGTNKRKTSNADDISEYDQTADTTSSYDFLHEGAFWKVYLVV